MCVKSLNQQELGNRKSEIMKKSNPEIEKFENSNNPQNPENQKSGWGGGPVG